MLNGTERFEAPEISLLHIPQGVIHTYANTGVQPAKALVVSSPAGMGGWFRDALHTRTPRGSLIE
jgi:hypothetical protein